MSTLANIRSQLGGGGGGFTQFEDDGPARASSSRVPAEILKGVATDAGGIISPETEGEPVMNGHTSGPQGKVQGKVKPAGDGKSSIPMASFNLSNAIIGAGVGGMPFALKEAGFYSGILLLIIVAMSSDYSVRLLITMGQKVNKHYYEQLVSSQFGHAGYVAVSAAMGIFAYGAMVAYLIGIGDTMSIVVANWAGIDIHTEPWLKRVVLVCISIGVVLPLAMLKNMAALSKTSFVSLMCVAFIILVVIIRAITGPGDAPVPVTEEDKALKFIDSKFFPAIGIISFAFVCHHACFIVYNTLRDNTNQRWAATVHMSLGVALGVMLSLSMAAYLTFRGVMESMFLKNYSYTDGLANMMRCMFAITQILTYPLELFVARHSIHALAFASERFFTDRQHTVITLLLWGSSLAIALNVTDLGVVLELTGGVSAVFIGFVMPAMLHFKLSEYDWRLWRNKGERLVPAIKELLPSWWLLIFGILAMVFTLITIGTAMILGEAGPHDAYAHGADGLTGIDEALHKNTTSASTAGKHMLLM